MNQELPERRVLLLEDDPLTLTLLEIAIQTIGFATHSTSSVTAAKQALKTFDPDLAILDIDLGPGLTGTDFAKVMSRTHPHVAVLFISRIPYEETSGAADKELRGKVGYLNKFNLHDFDLVRAAIEECLRPSRQAVIRPIFVAGQGLTRRQHSLLLEVANGLSYREIALKAGTTIRAIEYMAARIQTKFPEILLDSRALRLESVRTYLQGLG
jgi:DNA-binding NarL/FixJ family response regulator